MTGLEKRLSCQFGCEWEHDASRCEKVFADRVYDETCEDCQLYVPRIGPRDAEIAQLRTALRETREALADTLDLATKVAICEMEAMASKEPGSDVFGCAGIAEKAKVARARAAWKAFDDCVKPVLARHAGLVEEAGRG